MFKVQYLNGSIWSTISMCDSEQSAMWFADREAKSSQAKKARVIDSRGNVVYFTCG